ncbi:MAG: hypothetical protein JO001_14220 [Alphaproteobacteria bacterium]|nr:hypothetical protein [Alphaproteobacteria bacterium]
MSYRLSEAVFGSLLASYVLGFVGFVAVYIQPPKRFVVTSVKDGVFEIAEKTPELATISQVQWYPEGVLTLNYLCISAIFSMFTALLYFNYHATNMHLTSDQRTSAYDFFISVLIGVGFGFSMIVPLSLMFCIALLTVFALWRKSKVLRPVWLHIAAVRGALVRGIDPRDRTALTRYEHRVTKSVAKAFAAKDNDERLQGWGKLVTPVIGGFTTLMLAISAIAFGMKFFAPNLNYVGKRELLTGNLLICLLMMIFLVWQLLASARRMPAPDQDSEAGLDAAYFALIETISVPKR